MEQMSHRADFRDFLASFEAPVIERTAAMLCNLASGLSHSAALLSLRAIGEIDWHLLVGVVSRLVTQLLHFV
jgi:hypothetical protein